MSEQRDGNKKEEEEKEGEKLKNHISFKGVPFGGLGKHTPPILHTISHACIHELHPNKLWVVIPYRVFFMRLKLNKVISNINFCL